MQTGVLAKAGCDRIIFEGGGAGKVVFDETVHEAKGLTCSECHEGKGLSFALFEMQRGTDVMSMRRMERGGYCGKCHNISMSNTLTCSVCHQKD